MDTTSSSAGVAPDTRFAGFAFGYLPAGLLRADGDSFYTAQVGPEGLNQTAPAAGAPGASVRIRRFTDRAGASIFVTVLAPFVGSASDRSLSQLARWLTDAQMRGTAQTDSFDVTVGRAFLLEHRGTEAISHSLVIATPTGVVITVEGPASLTATELRRIAAGITAL